MQKLLEGILKFRQSDFETHRDLFKKLKSEQKPHTLFITCSDSRIDPNMITGTLPGELFIIRNIANIAPPYRESTEYLATTSAIEYAVEYLNVKDIIVCGHSNCGGCSASLESPESFGEKMPHTKKWLELMEPVRDRVLRRISKPDFEARKWMMEQENVFEQLNHLLTYPYIYKKVHEGSLGLSGWHYIIETGEVFIYDDTTGEFLLGNAHD